MNVMSISRRELTACFAGAIVGVPLALMLFGALIERITEMMGR
jgi:hypothetical protein